MLFKITDDPTKENQYDQELKTMLDSVKFIFKIVENKHSAKTVRASVREMLSILVRVTRAYSRGYDIKMADTALVIVVAEGESLRLNELRQMLGRSCRE